jgi:serine/threonine-protein phosphatase 2A regulatory subunit A
VYKRTDPAKKLELRTLYKEMTHDETPMVRRAAALNLGKLAAVMDPSNVSKDIIPIFHDLTQDGEFFPFPSGGDTTIMTFKHF